MFQICPLITILLLAGILLMQQSNLYEQYDMQAKNNFCQEQEIFHKNYQKNNEIVANLTYQNFINAPFINQMVCKWRKKQKLIWLQIDGMAYDQIQMLANWTRNDSFLVKSNGPDFRTSSPLWYTILTGQFTRDLAGSEIKRDNLFYQIEKPYFIGHEFPLYLMGKSFYDEVSIVERERGFLRDLCPNQSFLNINNQFSKVQKDEFWHQFDDEFSWDQQKVDEYLNLEENMEDKPSPKKWKECLYGGRVIYQANQQQEPFYNNIVYYTVLIDIYNHQSGRGSIDNYYKEYRAQQKLYTLQSYIIENLDDHVLVINSDHGGQTVRGDDNYNMHGFISKQNQAFIYISSNELKDQGFEASDIDTYDMGATIAQTIQNANIPLGSYGTPTCIYKNDKFSALLTSYSHYIQQKQLITEYSYQDSDFKEQIKQNKVLKFKQIEEKILKYEKKLQDKFGENHAFFDEKGKSLSSQENIDLLNEFDYSDIQNLLLDQNKIIQELQEQYRFKNINNFLLFSLLFIGIIVFVFTLKTKKELFFNYFAKSYFSHKSYKIQDNIVPYLGLILLFNNSILAFFFTAIYESYKEIIVILFFILKIALVILMNPKTDQENQEELQSKQQQFQKQSQQQLKIQPENNINENQGIETYENCYDDEEQEKSINQNAQISNLKIQISKQENLENQSVKQNSNFFNSITARKAIIFSIIMDSLLFIIISQDLFLSTKRKILSIHQSDMFQDVKLEELGFHINNLCYIIFLVQQYKENKQIFQSKENKPKAYIFSTLVALMIIYDQTPFESSKSYKQYHINTFTMLGIIYFLFYCLISEPLKQKNDQERINNQNQLQVSKNHSQVFLKVCFLLIFFYIADIVEKIVILAVFIPFSQFMFKIMKNKTLISVRDRFIIVFIVLRETSVFFILCKQQYQTTVNQDSGEKSLGVEKESVYPFTAFLLGINKMQGIIIPILYLFQIIHYTYTLQPKKQLKISNFSKTIIAVCEIKAVLAVLSSFFVLFVTKGEGYYIQYSIFYALSEITFLLIFYTPCLINYLKMYIPFKIKALQNKFVLLVIFSTIFVIHVYYLFTTETYFDELGKSEKI